MKELREFIKETEGFYGDDVTFAIGVIEEDKREFIGVDELLDMISMLNIKDVVAHYFESFEFFTYDDKYIEISVL